MTAGVAGRVARGAALLDGKDPGWWRADADPVINLDTLEMADGQHCVLGQRCPRELAGNTDPPVTHTTFYFYATALSGILDEAYLNAWAADHGFDALPLHYDDYRDLRAEWGRVITERRSQP